MDELLGKIFTTAMAAWTAVFMLAVRLFHTWPLVMARVNERLRDKEAEKNGEWGRLHAEIARLDARLVSLDARCDHLQHEVDECHRRESEWMQRAIAAEAYNLGQGTAFNEAQRIVSTEREADKAKGKPDA